MAASSRTAGAIVTVTEKMPETWLNLVEAKGHGVIGGEMLTRSEEADEFLLMGLRLAEGIDLARYEALAGRALSARRGCRSCRTKGWSRRSAIPGCAPRRPA